MNVSLQQRIDKIFDHLYAESKIKNPESVSFEFSKILHTGIYIEREHKVSPAFQEFLPSEGIFFDKEVINRTIGKLKNSFIKMNKSWMLFEKDEKINFSDADINYICSNLYDIQLSNKEHDILGDAIEIFRNYSVKSLGGQFFTDSTVTKLALEIINFNPLYGERFIDICCGTGGFLLAAINKIKKQLEINKIADEKYLANASKNHVLGKEIDKTIADAGNRNIQTRVGIKYQFIENIDALRLDNSYNNSFDCIATNPPFGTKTTIKDLLILDNYELARQINHTISPTTPDILFLEKNINLLKPETGKLAIVLPYQILSGPRAKGIRRWILEKCIILAVIDLPVETFQPHTGTKTSLLIVKKRMNKDLHLQDVNYNIFMSKPNWIGHDRRGNSVYKKNIDGTSTNEILCDFQTVEKDWNNYIQKKPLKSDISFIVEAKTIINDNELRLNALYYSISEKSIDKSESSLLKNLVKNIFYPGRFKRNYVDNSSNSVPFLGGANITEHILSTKKYISLNDPHINQLIVHEGWILITRSGTTGIISMVPKEWDGFAISEHVIRIIPDSSKENPFFIYAYLQTKSAQKQISRGVFGSVIDEINPESIGNIRIPKNIDLNVKRNIISFIQKYEEARNISLAAHKQAITIINKTL